MDQVPEDDEGVIHPRARAGHELPRRLSDRTGFSIHEGSATGPSTSHNAPSHPQQSTAPTSTDSTASQASPDKPTRRTSAQILQNLQAAAAAIPEHAEQQQAAPGAGVASPQTGEGVIADVLRKFKRASMEDAEAVRSRRG